LPPGFLLVNTTQGWLLGGDAPVGSGGVYPLTIEAVYGSVVATQSFTLTVDEAPSFYASPQVTFRAGSLGNFAIKAHGYPLPTITETGKLPYGVRLSTLGILNGTPGIHSGGIYHITVTADNGMAPSATEPFTITVDQSPAITSAGRATFRAGHLSTFTVKTTGFPAPALSERGRLPAGIRFEAHRNGTATLTGRAARSDAGRTFVITIIANNRVGRAARQTFRLRIT
jgi:hypothetical protein